MTPALVVFDLDGTLLDTHTDLVESLNYTIAAIGVAPVSYDDLTHLVGHGAKVMIERACGLRGHPLAQEQLPALLNRFIAHYTDNMPGHTAPYPSLVEGTLRFDDRMLDTAPFVAHGESVDGCLTRLSTAALLNVTAGGGSTVPTFVVEPR